MGFLTVRFHALAPIIAAQYRKSAPRRVAEEPISRFICDSNSLLGVVAALDDTSGLTAQVAQVVQLGATHTALADHLDGVDDRGVQREYVLLHNAGTCL